MWSERQDEDEQKAADTVLYLSNLLSYKIKFKFEVPVVANRKFKVFI